MRIIFTAEEKKTARKQIEGFRQSYVIDVREIILEFDYQEGQTIASPYDFIINEEIEKKLAQALVNKKSDQIIYFHYTLNKGIISNIKSFFKSRKAAAEFVVFDPRTQFKPLHKSFHKVLKPI